MIHHEHGIINELNKAQEWLRSHRAVDLIGSLTINNAMPARKSIRSVFDWFSGLFMRDGRPLEFFSAFGVLAWSILSDVSTDRNVISASMDAAIGLISPDSLVVAGYVLGSMQLIALMTLRRWLRAPVALMLSVFLGLLTQGVWNAPIHPPGSAFYGMAWVMNGYVFVRLCRPRA